MPISTYHTKHRSSDRESGIRNIRVISHSQESKQSSIIFKPAYLDINILKPVAEFKEFERRFKFKPRFKYGWFHLKLYQMFQDLNRRLI